MKLHHGNTEDRSLGRFADGRVWRLTRGRDFAGSVHAFRRSLDAAATAMGKTARAVPDKLQPEKYVWVQFGAATIGMGEPCICGSKEIARLHRVWGRCSGCGALLELVPEPVNLEGGLVGDGQRLSPQTPLDAYAEVELYRHALSDTSERCFGLARSTAGAEVLVSVTFALDDGRRIPHPKVPGCWYYTYHEMPADRLEPLLDLDELRDGTPVRWRIAEDPGPLPADDLEPAAG
jgi:hypothetical protein